MLMSCHRSINGQAFTMDNVENCDLYGEHLCDLGLPLVLHLVSPLLYHPQIYSSPSPDPTRRKTDVICVHAVLDACAQVTVDNARNCRIFIGPTEGSVFIRDCTNCKFAIVCRQLRTRDCHDVDTALFCRTKPIIETSSNVSCRCILLEP